MRRSCSPTSWSFRMRSASTCASTRAKARGLTPLDDPAAMLKLRGTTDRRRARADLRNDRLVKPELPPAVTLLGFCGAPWTVATYMVAGRGTPDQAPARLFAYRHPEAFAPSDRCSGRGVGRLSRSRSSRPASMRCRSSIPGPEFCRRTNSSAGALRRPQRIVAECAARGAGREDHRLSARRRQQSEALRRAT